jgi:hypothetical protein
MEIIPYDLDGNCCEFIASVCFRILFGVPMKYVAIGGDEQVLRTTKTCKMLTSMLVMRKAQKGTKGKTIHRP